MEEIKTGNISRVEEMLSRIMDEISKLNYNNILISLLHLIDTIRNAVDSVNQSRVEPVCVNFASFSQKVFEFETMEEFHEKVLEYIRQLTETEKSCKNEKHVILVETIQEIIQKNFFDSNLCLTEIASMVKMSSKHIGRIFKENTGMSIPEYINEIRLTKAAEWLGNSELNVNEIILKVGIENQTYFYSLFKKRFGITPKEYAMQKTIKGI